MSEDLSVTDALERGTTRFLGLELEVARGAKVARPESELLAEEAARLLAPLPPGARALDLCCGSGNLACVLAFRAPQAEVWACDLLAAAVELTRRNARRLGLTVHVFQGDLLGALAGQGLEGTVDLVVCSPPSIPTAVLEREGAELLAHEPREAFDGGPKGTSVHGRVVKEVLPFLKAGGALLLELGPGQARPVTGLLERSRAYREVRLVSDAAGGEPRVVVARKS